MVVPGIVHTPFSKVPGDTVQTRKASPGAAAIVLVSVANPRQMALARATMPRTLMNVYLLPGLSEGNGGQLVLRVNM